MQTYESLPESEIIASIERLEHDLRGLYRRIEHAPTPADKKVLNQQLHETLTQINNLRERLKR